MTAFLKTAIHFSIIKLCMSTTFDDFDPNLIPSTSETRTIPTTNIFSSEYTCNIVQSYNVDKVGYITFAAMQIPLVIFCFLFYRHVLVKRVIKNSEEEYDHQKVKNEWYGIITNVKLILKGITLASILTVMVVTTYTMFFTNVSECQTEGIYSIPPKALNFLVWASGLLFYGYLWFWDMKQQHKHKHSNSTSSLHKILQKCKTILICQIISFGIGTAFFQSVHIGDIIQKSNDEIIEQNCLCANSNIVFYVQIIWACQIIALIIKYCTKEKFEKIWYIVIVILLCLQLTLKVIVMVQKVNNLKEVGVRYMSNMDWGDVLFIWLFCCVVIVGGVVLFLCCYIWNIETNSGSDNSKKANDNQMSVAIHFDAKKTVELQLKSENQAMIEKAKKREKTISDLQFTVQNNGTELKKYKQQINHLNNQIESYKSNYDVLKNQYKETHKIKSENNDKIIRLTAELESVKQQNDHKLQQTERKKTYNYSLKNANDEHIADQNVKNQQDKIAKLQIELIYLKETNDKLNKTIKDMEREYIQLDKTFEEYKQSMHDKINELKLINNKTQTSMNKLQTDNEILNQNLKKKENQFDELLERYNVLNSQDLLNEKYKLKSAEYSTLLQDYNEHIEQNNKEQETMMNEIKNLKTVIKELSVELRQKYENNNDVLIEKHIEWKAQEGKRHNVVLFGSWNDFKNGVELKYQGKQVYACDVKLPFGTHEYGFAIDDNHWEIHNNAPKTIMNDNQYNQIYVTERSGEVKMDAFAEYDDGDGDEIQQEKSTMVEQ